jgi:hypothetical protein
MKVAFALHRSELSLFYGLVTAVDDAHFYVSCDDRCRIVKRAAGCLLRPELGDTVLISCTEEFGYLLQVLERAQSSAAELSVEGGLTIVAGSGLLTLEAKCGVALNADAGLVVNTARADMHCVQLNLTGDTVRACWRDTALSTQRRFVSAVFDETLLTDSVRRVSGHDEQTAQSMRLRVERDWVLQTHDAAVQAESRVVVKAKQQVQLG